MPNQRVSERETGILKYAVRILREELHPRRIVLFGSRVKGTARKGSDFDLAMDCQAPPFSDAHRIREKLSEKTGLYHIDLVFLPSVSRGFRDLILKTGKVVYARRS
jgi:predicted nucleotidyltransferase